MDEITAEIREMYEKFPYPSGPPKNRVGSDVDLLLSCGALAPPKLQPRQVLDAGCGRAVGLIGAATLQPQVQFTGIDINRVALEDAQVAIGQRGLDNVRLQEVDLMTLAGLEAPSGGFDVIHSSGVLHHLADPAAGLALLKEKLAPHGMINLMVYGRNGRDPLLKTAAAIDGLFPAGDVPLADRVGLARQVAVLAADHVLKGTRFENTGEVDDVEFVDRLLNVNETSYDIDDMWALIEMAGLRFVRWVDPLAWDIDSQLPDSDLRRRLHTLPLLDQYRFLERVLCPTSLELVLARKDNVPREPLDPLAIVKTVFRVSPEVVIGTGVRHSPAGLRTETLNLTVRDGQAIPVGAGPTAAALLALREWVGDIPGRSLVKKLAAVGVAEETVSAVVMELLRVEVLYRPHR